MVITTGASSSIRALHVQRTDRAMNNAMPAKGHNWGYEYIRQATCTEDGYKSYDCMNKGCTATKKDTLLDGSHIKFATSSALHCNEKGYSSCHRSQAGGIYQV